MNKVSDWHVANKYLNLHKNAAKRNIEFTLSLNDVRKLLQATRCAYTGVPFTPRIDNTTPFDNARTIDRVCADEGYTPSNCVACTYSFNLLKGSLTSKQIVNMYKVLVKIKGPKI